MPPSSGPPSSAPPGGGPPTGAPPGSGAPAPSPADADADDQADGQGASGQASYDGPCRVVWSWAFQDGSQPGIWLYNRFGGDCTGTHGNLIELTAAGGDWAEPAEFLAWLYEGNRDYWYGDCTPTDCNGGGSGHLHAEVNWVGNSYQTYMTFLPEACFADQLTADVTEVHIRSRVDAPYASQEWGLSVVTSYERDRALPPHCDYGPQVNFQVNEMERWDRVLAVGEVRFTVPESAAGCVLPPWDAYRVQIRKHGRNPETGQPYPWGNWEHVTCWGVNDGHRCAANVAGYRTGRAQQPFIYNALIAALYPQRSIPHCNEPSPPPRCADWPPVSLPAHFWGAVTRYHYPNLVHPQDYIEVRLRYNLDGDRGTGDYDGQEYVTNPVPAQVLSYGWQDRRFASARP